MGKIIEVEIGAELAVYAFEQVEVKGGRYALSVVVGADYHVRVFFQVEAGEKQVVLVHHAAQLLEKIERLPPVEISDIRTEKHQDLTPPGPVFQSFEDPEIVAGFRLDNQIGKFKLKFG